MTALTLSTYSDLQAFAIATLNRTDLADYVPGWIAMATGQISDRLLIDGGVRQMIGRADLTVANEYVTVPTDFDGVVAVYLAGNYLPLEFISPEEVVARKTLYPSASGPPQAIALVGDELQFWPWVTASYSGKIVYRKRIAHLTVSVTSNWLLVRRPDVYLYTTLIQSAPFLRDDARLPVWAGLAEAGITDMMKASKMANSAPHLGVGIVPGGTP